MFAPFTLNRGKMNLMAAVVLAGLGSVAQATEVKIPDTTITASLRSSFTYTDTEGAATSTSDFALNSFNIYLNSKITENIKFSFSSEITGVADASSPSGSNTALTVQDAIAQFEYGPTMNIWVGRFLAPTDRANSYGAYFSNNWNFASDGTQDGYPFIDKYGRADGVAYWGDFADTKLKVSAGLFEIPATAGKNESMVAARVQYDFWDAEPGYYINGTYLGEKNILAVGAATNMVDGDSTTNVDFLMEKKVGDGGAFTVEGEYIVYDKLGGYDANFSEGNSYYLMSSYLFPGKVGPGKVSLLGKFGTTSYEKGVTADYEQDTTEFNVNYFLKSFNAKISLFMKDTAYSATSVKADNTQIGLGVQLMTL